MISSEANGKIIKLKVNEGEKLQKEQFRKNALEKARQQEEFAKKQEAAAAAKQEAKQTAESEAKRIGEETYYEQVGEYWVVYRKSDKKVLKSINYFRPNLKKFL